MTVVRLFMFQCLMTVLLAIPFNLKAQSPRPGQQIQEVSQVISQYLNRGDEVRVMQELRLAQHQQQDKQILSISALVQKSSASAALQLQLNGRLVGQMQTIRQNGMVHLEFLLPQNERVNSLQLKVITGQVFVQSISAKISGALVSPGHQMPQLLTAPVNQTFPAGSPSLIGVRQIMQQNNIPLQGRKVMKVLLLASSAAGRGTAELIVNGRRVGLAQNIGVRESQVIMSLGMGNNTIGQDLNTLQVELRGNIFVRSISVEVQSTRPQAQDLALQIRRQFRGLEHISLASLIPARSPDISRRNIQSISILASSPQRGMIAIKKNGMVIQEIHMSGNNANQAVALHGFTTVHDIQLEVRGIGVIDTIRINFNR